MTSGVTDALEPSPHTKGCSGVTVIVMPLSISPPSDGNVPVWHRRTTNYPAWRLLPPEPADTSTGNPKRLITMTMLADNGALLVVMAASGG